MMKLDFEKVNEISYVGTENFYFNGLDEFRDHSLMTSQQNRGFVILWHKYLEKGISVNCVVFKWKGWDPVPLTVLEGFRFVAQWVWCLHPDVKWWLVTSICSVHGSDYMIQKGSYSMSQECGKEGGGSSKPKFVWRYLWMILLRPLKIIWIVISIHLSLMSILTSIGIIWFERFGSDLKRICINRIISSVSWATLAWYILVQPADIFIYFYRPLPEWYCFFKLMLQNALVLQYILFYNSIIVIRYIFIFCLKNPENFQDDFWYRFINIWIVAFRFTFSKVMCYELTFNKKI